MRSGPAKYVRIGPRRTAEVRGPFCGYNCNWSGGGQQTRCDTFRVALRWDDCHIVRLIRCSACLCGERGASKRPPKGVRR